MGLGGGTQGAFDWTFLDSETGRATQANKDIILRVISGGVNVPAWVFGLGAPSSPCDPVETPRTAVITGLGYNTRYQEISCVDLLNPQLQPMLTKLVDRFK